MNINNLESFYNYKNLFYGVSISALVLISLESLYFYHYYNESKQQIEKITQLKNEERIGRINTQQKLRNLITENNNINNGYNLEPIGYVESPYNERRGTPRQPMLVPAGVGRIKFNKQKIQSEYFQELKEFSHVFVMFIFHNNTNTDSNTHAKIKPPRLFGKKVGCLSTRSPHRPNSIGLSVCEIINVTNDSIELACLDMIHGSPVLDSKIFYFLIFFNFYLLQ